MSGDEEKLAAQVRFAAQRQEQIEMGQEVVVLFQNRAVKRVLSHLEEKYQAEMLRAPTPEELWVTRAKLLALRDLLKELRVVADRGFVAARQGAAADAEQPDQPLTNQE